MEGLAAASAVVAVVSLAGQVLKGCTYLRDVLQNAIEAPRECQLLLEELTVIEEIAEKSLDTPTHQRALDLCNERLSKVCDMMSKYMGTEKEGRCRKWGKQLSMALSTDTMQKHLNSLREARGYLESAQNKSISTEILEKSQDVLESVEKISVSQSEATHAINEADRKLDDIHSITQETQRVLHELADRFVLLDAKSRIWAQQNERMLRCSVEKTIRDNFERLFLPAFTSIAEQKQQSELGFQSAPPNYYLDWTDASTSAGFQGWLGDQMLWENQPRIVELPDHFSIQATSWNQKDFPPYVEKRSLSTTPANLRFLRFQRQSSRQTKCVA